MIDFTKPVQTRDGRKARVLDTNFKHPTVSTYTVVAAIEIGSFSEKESLFVYETNGTYPHGGPNNPSDLIQAPTPLPMRWLNVYQYGNGDTYVLAFTDKEKADSFVQSVKRIACIEVKGNVGDGLPA